MNNLGKPILAIGVIILLVAFTMNTSVESGYGRVNNIGLMADRSNFMIFGTLLFIGGVILIALNKNTDATLPLQKSNFIKCPFCAEPISPEAKLCKHCKSELTPTEEPGNTTIDRTATTGNGTQEGILNGTETVTNKFFKELDWSRVIAIGISTILLTLPIMIAAHFTIAEEWRHKNFGKIILLSFVLSLRTITWLAKKFNIKTNTFFLVSAIAFSILLGLKIIISDV